MCAGQFHAGYRALVVTRILFNRLVLRVESAGSNRDGLGHVHCSVIKVSSFREGDAARLDGRGCGGGPCGLCSRVGGSSRFLSFGLWLIAITIHTTALYDKSYNHGRVQTVENIGIHRRVAHHIKSTVQRHAATSRHHMPGQTDGTAHDRPQRDHRERRTDHDHATTTDGRTCRRTCHRHATTTCTDMLTSHTDNTGTRGTCTYIRIRPHTRAQIPHDTPHANTPPVGEGTPG